MKFNAWHARELDSAESAIAPLDHGHELVLTNVLPAHLDAITGRLKAARPTLQHTPVAVIIEAIDRAAAMLADPKHELGAAARALLPAVTGYSQAMADHVLAQMTRDWRAPALTQMIASEFGSPDVLDGFVESAGARKSTAIGASLTTHIFSGNVPGVAVTSLVRALLVKSPSFGKTARDEPVLPVLFAQALERVSPAIASAIAVVHFAGGNKELEDTLLGLTDLLVVYGGEQAASALRARTNRIVLHGPKLSLGLVHARAINSTGLVKTAALAVATFDQQGCVSPHMIFVLTDDPQDAREFAREMSAALHMLEGDLPRGKLSPPEAVAMQNARTEAEFQHIAGAGTELFTTPASTVVWQAAPSFRASCLNRFVYVSSVPSTDDLVELLRPHGDVLQSIAIEGFPETEAAELGLQLGSIGATRITTFDRLPWPPADWHHDGAAPLRELVRWIDWER